jgi:hypothetical protein
MESEHQITYLWMTPPKGDQRAEYGVYKKQLALAEEAFKRPRNPEFIVPDNLTRKENTWVVSASRWALTHGVDAKGKPRACADVVPLLTPKRGVVTVTRPFCETFRDRFPQTERPKQGVKASAKARKTRGR